MLRVTERGFNSSLLDSKSHALQCITFHLQELNESLRRPFPFSLDPSFLMSFGVLTGLLTSRQNRKGGELELSQKGKATFHFTKDWSKRQCPVLPKPLPDERCAREVTPCPPQKCCNTDSLTKSALLFLAPRHLGSKSGGIAKRAGRLHHLARLWQPCSSGTMVYPSKKVLCV